MRSKCFGKELPALSNFIQIKNFFLLSAERPRYEFTLQCYAGFVSSGFPSKFAQDKRDDNRRTVRSFIYPVTVLSPYSARLCAPCV